MTLELSEEELDVVYRALITQGRYLETTIVDLRLYSDKLAKEKEKESVICGKLANRVLRLLER